MTGLRLVGDQTETEKMLAELRSAALAASEQDANLPAKYFATWLVFYIAQYESLGKAWQDSIDRMAGR